MTDDEIRSLIRWQYNRGKDLSPMAEIIFKIACMVRDRLQQPESDTVLNLRERLDMSERGAKTCWEHLKKADDQNEWRERYHRLHKIHCEVVRRLKEVRRFRPANFSIAELEAELQRKKEIQRRADFLLEVDMGPEVQS